MSAAYNNTGLHRELGIECQVHVIIITSHGENGSRPQRPLYPRNNDRVMIFDMALLVKVCFTFYMIFAV